MNQSLFTLTITGGGTKSEILRALKNICNSLEYGKQNEIEYEQGEIFGEITEVCPYHEMDNNFDNN